MPIPATINDVNVQDYMGEELLFLEFYGKSCGPCRQLGPFIDRLAAAGAGKYVVGKVDVAEAPELTRALGVASTPTMLVVQRGQVVGRHVGMNNIQFALKPLLK